jgi:hypothetical protein
MVNAEVVKEQVDGKWRVGVRFTRDEALADGVDAREILDGTRLMDTEQEADADITKIRGFLADLGAEGLMKFIIGDIAQK